VPKPTKFTAKRLDVVYLTINTYSMSKYLKILLKKVFKLSIFCSFTTITIIFGAYINPTYNQKIYEKNIF
tara:strand:+ start:224 stop:433 length:210 start_codon:yes stop_codon:yes gene_type:complete